MNLYINNLFVRYCNESKNCITHELSEDDESPYYDVEDIETETLEYRIEYVETCLAKAISIWNECKFSNDLTVLYEDKFSCHSKNEKEFIESTLNSSDCRKYIFKWDDDLKDGDRETFTATRYIWKTDTINIKDLFRKIILSDIGENTNLDCAVYIIDNKTKTVFFICDDRFVDIFSRRCKFH